MRVFGSGRGRSAGLVTADVALAWAGGLLMMLAAYRRGDFDPTARQNGMDWPGDLERLMGTSAVAALVLWAVLRPWSFRGSWRRLLFAAALFTPYVALRMIAGVHGGPVMAAHDLWLLLLWAGLLAGAGLLAARIRGRVSDAPPVA